MAGGDTHIRLDNGQLILDIARDFGPRITHFSTVGKPNVLAELGDLSIDLPDGRRFVLRGGHRLWAAPEVPEITYEPDDSPVEVIADAVTATVTRPATPPVNIEKRMRVRLHGDAAEIDHTLINRSTDEVEFAPWAITQLIPGGVAVLPLPLQPLDVHGLQPNASVVLWPYTGSKDDPFTLENRLVLLDTKRTDPTKVGIGLDRGWLAYQYGPTVFAKFASHQPGGRYLDMGASGQVYACADFTELETLGQVETILPGGSVHHRETWRLFEASPGSSPADLPSSLGFDSRASGVARR